jgi:hypothetical protein
MNLERILVRLVIADIALVAAAIGAGYALEGSLPAALQAYLAVEREAAGGAGGWALTTLWWGMAAGSVVSWAALVQFWRRGRELYLGVSILWAAYLALSGSRVMSAPEYTLGLLEAMVAGAILALVYFSDLRKEYVKTPQAA